MKSTARLPGTTLPIMYCDLHEQLIQDHLRCFNQMRCARTWEEALTKKLLAESASTLADDHRQSCPECRARIPAAASFSAPPAWQSGLY